LSDIEPSKTTIAQLRESVQSELGGSTVVPTEKIKILYKKKPVPTSKKTVSDALEGEIPQKGKTVELGVMILGGAPDPLSKTGTSSTSDAKPAMTEEAAEAPTTHPERMEGIETMTSQPPAQGPSGEEILKTDDFWTDLQGYLEQRIKDEARAAILVQMWKSNWSAH
jgi:ubiquitin-like protein 4